LKACNKAGRKGGNMNNKDENLVLEIRQTSLSTHSNSIHIPATNIPLLAKNHFAVRKNNVSPVKISFMGERFEDWFMGKKEEPFKGSILSHQELSYPSTNSQVTSRLGGFNKAETTLTELSYLMKAQWNGQEGPLLTNRKANIFYIRDIHGKLRSVDAHWFDGWRLAAGLIEHPCILEDGFRIFYRNR
jgi:hypothetical protein